MLRKILLFIAFFLTIIVIVASLLPLKGVPSIVSVSDKIMHSTAYAVITFFWLLAIPIKKKWKILLNLFFMGIIIEIAQGTLTKNRQAEILDIIANTIGILTSYMVFVLFFKKKHIESKNNL